MESPPATNPLAMDRMPRLRLRAATTGTPRICEDGAFVRERRPARAVDSVPTSAIGKKLGKDKGNSKYLYPICPCGSARQACRCAEADGLRLKPEVIDEKGTPWRRQGPLQVGLP